VAGDWVNLPSSPAAILPYPDGRLNIHGCHMQYPRLWIGEGSVDGFVPLLSSRPEEWHREQNWSRRRIMFKRCANSTRVAVPSTTWRSWSAAPCESPSPRPSPPIWSNRWRSSSTLAIRGVDQHQRPGPGRDGGGAAANTLDVGVAFDDVRSEDVAAEPLHQERLCLIVAKGIPPVATRSCLPPSLQGMDLALLNTPSMRPHDNRPRPPTTSSSRRGLILKLVRPVGCRCPSTASARSPRSCRRSLRATLLAKTKSNLKSIRVELLRCDDRHLRLKR
jgi:hypothetical protein